MIKSFLRRLKRMYKATKKPHIFKRNGHWWVIGKDNENFRKAVVFIGDLSLKEYMSKGKLK